MSTEIKNRVVEFRLVPAVEIEANPRNWRTHSKKQRAAIRGVLGEIGYAGAELCYYSERNGGKLTLIDGHLRKEEMSGQSLPCLITDLSDSEADKLLLTFDPIGAMAGADAELLSGLLSEVQTQDNAVSGLLKTLAKSAGCEYGNGDDVVEDDIPDAPAEPTTKKGDLWLLGNHRLLCGDSTNAEDVKRVMGGGRGRHAAYRSSV